MLNAFLQWLDETRLWKWFARTVLGKLTLRLAGYPEFNFDARWGELVAVLNETEQDPNGVYAFVSSDRYALSSVLIRLVSKSEWSHAGWIVGWKAIHMKAGGLHDEHVANVLKECDDFAIVRFETAYKRVINSRLNSYRQNPEVVSYDYEQELSSDASPLEANDIFCSELVWVVGRPELPLLPSRVAGRLCFSPDDVAKQGTVVFIHKSRRSAK